jgi:nitric oxide reductase large subunit
VNELRVNEPRVQARSVSAALTFGHREASRISGRRHMNDTAVVQIIAVMIALALYFLPAILADRRKRVDVLTLALFNACLGWTVLGWLLALYWSLQPNPPKNLAGDVEEQRKVVRMRAFSSALLLRVQRRSTTRNGSQE